MRPSCSLREISFSDDIGKIVSSVQTVFVVPFRPHNVSFSDYCNNMIYCSAITFTAASVVLEISSEFTKGAALRVHPVSVTYKSSEQKVYGHFNISRFASMFTSSLSSSELTCFVEYPEFVEGNTLVKERLGIVTNEIDYQWTRPKNHKKFSNRATILFTTLHQ